MFKGIVRYVVIGVIAGILAGILVGTTSKSEVVTINVITYPSTKTLDGFWCAEINTDSEGDKQLLWKSEIIKHNKKDEKRLFAFALLVARTLEKTLSESQIKSTIYINGVEIEKDNHNYCMTLDELESYVKYYNSVF